MPSALERAPKLGMRSAVSRLLYTAEIDECRPPRPREGMAGSQPFARETEVRADTELQRVRAINEVLLRLGCGDVPSRAVLAFP